jgi:DNA-binding protein H-NS
MATYLELKAQAEKLMAEAEALRSKELEDTIADIKNKMQAYGITAQDLGLTGATGKRSTSPKQPNKTPKYRGPNGQAYSGRGPRPKWLKEALASGKKIEDFAAG